MNHLELQALRQLFSMSINEAASYISGDHDVETWRQWEQGKQTIPSHVIETLTTMNQKRKDRLDAIINKINNRIGNNTMRFFPDYDAFRSVYTEGDFLEWKVYQSVATELYAHNLERLC
ncbi:YdiL family protein [Martelella alba]|uniref:DUF1870 family protein n=1 Tax=Martelella alba TaxID=2590451 RepID=A0ABY2SL74_9HYPH|nr:YdiL family protein [Martelella alba]TKI06487.1 DUF1870 family protein [Martelella alba]